LGQRRQVPGRPEPGHGEEGNLSWATREGELGRLQRGGLGMVPAGWPGAMGGGRQTLKGV